jgi:hypothetical protein
MSLRLAAACIAGAVIVGSAGNAQAQGTPDLTVAISASHNPVVNRGPNDFFEVMIQVSNLAPPTTIIMPFTSPGTLRAPEGISPPPGIPPRPSPPQGADVPQATIIWSSEFVISNASGGLVQLQSDPALNMNCPPANFENASRCTIGPLRNGGSWLIVLVFQANAFPPGSRRTFTVTVDDGNQVAERNDNNNTARVTVDFQ